MVQILPPKTDIGSLIGQGLGQGIGAGIQRGADIGFQRNITQQALQGLQNLPPGTSAAELLSHLIQATAGIPGAERYVGQIYPTLLAQMRGENAEQQGGTLAQRGGQFPQTGGYLNPPRNEQEKLQFAKQYSLNDPTKLKEGLDIANSLSAGSEANLIDFQNRLTSQGVSKDEMPYAMQIAQASNEKNPEKLLVETKRALDEIRSLDNILVPGFTKGALTKIGPPFLSDFLRRGESREKALSRIAPIAEGMVKSGREPILRAKLAAQDLSPTEIEEIIHPLSPQHQNAIKSLPPASKRSPEKNSDTIAEFFKKNLTPYDSLLVLRHKLVKEKGYNWKDVNQGFEKARKDLPPITSSQSTELNEFSTRPPRDSLSDIFSDWMAPIQYLRGEK